MGWISNRVRIGIRLVFGPLQNAPAPWFTENAVERHRRRVLFLHTVRQGFTILAFLGQCLWFDGGDNRNIPPGCPIRAFSPKVSPRRREP